MKKKEPTRRFICPILESSILIKHSKKEILAKDDEPTAKYRFQNFDIYIK
jgi:hypothetical protein